MSENRQIIKNSKIMMIVTTVSRVFGLVRDQVIGFYLGTTRWGDVWTISFMLPNMFRRLIAEGAMASAIVPLYSEISEKETEASANEFIRAVFSLILVVSTLLVSAIVLLLPYILPALLSITEPGVSTTDDDLSALLIWPTRLMFPYLIFISLAAICQGVLNVQNRFAIAASTPILLNGILIISISAFHDTWSNPVPSLVLGVLVGGFMQFFVQWAHLYRLGFRIIPTTKFWGKRTVEAVRLWIPSVFSAGIVQINALVSTLVATNILVGAATAVTMSTRLMELVLGVFAVAVSTSILPVLARQFSRGDTKSMAESLYGSMEVMSFICIPAAMGLILGGPSLVAFLFERGAFTRESTELTYLAVIFHGMAIVPICWYRIMTQAFYATKKVRLMVWIASSGALINIVCCYTLPSLSYFPHTGVAAATLVSSWALYGLARYKVKKHIGLEWPNHVNRELMKMVVATAAFVPVWLPFRPTVLPLYMLLLKVVLSVAIYAIVAAVLRVSGLARMLRKK